MRGQIKCNNCGSVHRPEWQCNSERSPFHEGKIAGYNRQSENDNPYDPQSFDGQGWLDGFILGQQKVA